MKPFAVVLLLILSLRAALSAQERQDSSLSYARAMHTAFNLYERTREARYWETAFNIAESKKNAFLIENLREGRISQTDPELTAQKPTIVELQSMLRNKETAVLSYSSGPDELYVFLVTKGTFYAAHLPVGSIFFSQLNALKTSLQARKGFEKAVAHQLYQKLIAPVKPYLQEKTHLVIIPDEETGLIPFEALVSDTASTRFLLHDYAISYSYSVSALTRSVSSPATIDRQKVLALAPFNIPASEKEIMNIKAEHVLGSNASSERFLEIARDYSIIHLSTYATISDPERSFIDFNTGKAGTKAGNRLFTRDIYRMDLNNVNLVILSPCQVPERRSVSSSGLVVMAHAFAHAGCPNFITSLWKTEDETADKISMKLHQYIHKGYGYARALQKARIDYLANPAVDEQLKSPGYWAGFILIGEINTVPQSHKFFYYFALAFTVLVVVYILRKKNHHHRHAEYPEYP